MQFINAIDLSCLNLSRCLQIKVSKLAYFKYCNLKQVTMGLVNDVTTFNNILKSFYKCKFNLIKRFIAQVLKKVISLTLKKNSKYLAVKNK